MALVLDEITHRYGVSEVLRGASLSVEEGEIVCLFGPSGCGKTTLLRVAAGLSPLQGGSVRLNGESLASVGAETAPERRAVGFVFQDYVLFPHLTVLENAGFGLMHLPRSERISLATAELKRVGLSGFERRYPDQLSGGQQQRVALARAFARRPLAMLLDEPFASIDAALRRSLRTELRQILKAHDVATILVTHDAEEALALGDRIAIMAHGRVVEAATPQELFEKPATAIGASIFPGSQVLEGVASEGSAATLFGAVPVPHDVRGPVRIVVQPGGVEAKSDDEGGLIAVDCRFIGPDWMLRLVAEPGAEALEAPSISPADRGARFALSFDPARIKTFAAG